MILRPRAQHRGEPVLRIIDETEARSFYGDFLGFEIGWAYKIDGKPVYMGLAMGEHIQLHLTESPNNAEVGGYIAIDDVDRYCADLRARDPNFEPVLEDKPYGMREFRVVDPFGNRLKFASSLE